MWRNHRIGPLLALTVATTLVTGLIGYTVTPAVAMLVIIPVLFCVQTVWFDMRIGTNRTELTKLSQRIEALERRVAELCGEVATNRTMISPALGNHDGYNALHPYIDRLLHHSRRHALKGVLSPVIHGEHEIYVTAANLVRSELLGPSDWMYALCVDKSWDLESLTSYWIANLDAVTKRRARIERIFVSGDAAAKREAEDQAAFGITVRTINRGAYSALMRDKGLPSAFGLCIFRHKALVHWGVGPEAQGVLLESLAAVEELMSVYRVLQANAKQVGGATSPRLQ
jgi:hypothetical protein